MYSSVQVTAGDSQLVVNYVLQFQATCPEVEGHLELWELPLTAKPAWPSTGCTVVVRAWTDHYEDWMKVRSDLSAALAAALARENIKLA